jgi:hypothetical protein
MLRSRIVPIVAVLILVLILAIFAIFGGTFKVSATDLSVPDAPTHLTAEGGDGEATLTWMPAPDGGALISDYTAEYSSDNGDTWTPVQTGIDDTYQALHNITPATDGTGLMTLQVHNGKFYGLMGFGIDVGGYDSGSLFSMDLDGSNYTVLHIFTPSDHSHAYGLSGMVFDDNVIYISALGRDFAEPEVYGEISRINDDGSNFEIVRQFPRLGEGSAGYFNKLFLINGKLYFFAAQFSSNVSIYGRIDTDGTHLEILHTFSGDEAKSINRIAFNDDSSSIYGFGNTGGVNDAGTVFKINLDGTGYTSLHDFGPTGGVFSDGFIRLDNTLYGFTDCDNAGCYDDYPLSPMGGGTYFSINTDGSNYQVLKTWPNGQVYVGSPALSNDDGSFIYTTIGCDEPECIDGHDGKIIAIDPIDSEVTILADPVDTDYKILSPLLYSNNKLYGVSGYAYDSSSIFSFRPIITYTIPSLTNGTDYLFRVSAVNSEGSSTPSASAALSLPILATPPSAPTELSGTVTTSQISLSWTAPGANGSPITDYVIEYKAHSGPSYAVFSDGTSTQASAVVTGLSSGQQYDIRVSAINAIGTGTPVSATISTASSENNKTSGTTSIPPVIIETPPLLTPPELPTLQPPAPANTIVSITAVTPTIFPGMVTPVIITLQQYLNNHGFVIAVAGPGSLGKETALFGRLTKAALIRFQKAHGIPATGVLGPITRKYIETHP